MTKKELATTSETLPENFTEEEALQAWRQKALTPLPKTNYIYLDNDMESETFGTTFAVSYDKEGAEAKVEVVAGEEFFPIIARVKISSKEFVKVGDKMKPEYYSKEHGQFEDIQLFDINDEVVFEGPYKEAKKQFTNIKYQLNLYVYMNETVYRWKVSGKTLGTWITIQNQINKISMPRTVKMIGTTKDSMGAIKYFYNEFEVSGEFDTAKAWQLVTELENALSFEKDVSEVADEVVEEVTTIEA